MSFVNHATYFLVLIWTKLVSTEDKTELILEMSFFVKLFKKRTNKSFKIAYQHRQHTNINDQHRQTNTNTLTYNITYTFISVVINIIRKSIFI